MTSLCNWPVCVFQLNESYEIMVIIRKGDREQRTTLEMEIRVDPMPDVIIKWVTSMVWYSTWALLNYWTHDDDIKWEHFPRYWPFVRGIHRSPVNSPHKGLWGRVLIFSLICASINGWVNTRDAGDLRRYRAHHYVIVMCWSWRAGRTEATDSEIWQQIQRFGYGDVAVAAVNETTVLVPYIEVKLL